jgi:poly-gamma-glutamate synthesis protein (capsule biosynthesis protein)
MKIILLGDIMLGRSFNKLFIKNSLYYPFGNTIHLLNSADIVIGNLETTITHYKKQNKWPNKTFHFQLNPKYINVLKIANLSFLSLANNHILDYNFNGMSNTFSYLKKLNIKFTGAGFNLKQAMKPVFIKKNGIKFGFLSASDHYHYWSANNKNPGIWFINIKNKSTWKFIFNYVASIKKNCDFLFFSLHWNYNYVDSIQPIFINFAHSLIDYGVNVIHGHSPHHILPYEKYKNGIIFYSLGDFIDDYAIDKKYRNDIGMIVELNIQSNNLNDFSYQIYHTIIKNMQVNIVNK